jgi:hypothetical protein
VFQREFQSCGVAGWITPLSAGSPLVAFIHDDLAVVL